MGGWVQTDNRGAIWLTSSSFSLTRDSGQERRVGKMGTSWGGGA